MDFNLPLSHGREVLIRIKESLLKDVPLVVLTTYFVIVDYGLGQNIINFNDHFSPLTNGRNATKQH